MTAELVVLIGMPASGKSTWARADAEQNKGRTMIVSRDAIRLHMFGVVHDPEIEGRISWIQDSLILTGLWSGLRVVVDNTNLRTGYRNALVKLARESGVPVKYSEIFFSTPITKCIERNAERALGRGRVPDEDMARFAKLAAPFYSGKLVPQTFTVGDTVTQPDTQDRELPPAVICDLDGTLCDLNGRDPYDPTTCDQDLPVRPVLDALEGFFGQGKAIVFVSGREDRFREPTMAFLTRHVKFPFELHMRTTKDNRPDPVIKREIFEQEIKNKFRVVVVLDDRPRVVRMWRHDLGLCVFQLNDKEF